MLFKKLLISELLINSYTELVNFENNILDNRWIKHYFAPE